MIFSKAQLCYINPLYYTYIYLTVRITVTNVWYRIKNVLERLPVEYRKEMLKGV